jgi:hypothetical protein
LYDFFSLNSKTKRNNSRNNKLLVPRYPNYYSQYFSTPCLIDWKTVLVPVLIPGLVRDTGLHMSYIMFLPVLGPNHSNLF